MTIIIPRSRGEKRVDELLEFAAELKIISLKAGMKVSSRGWCYLLEGFGLITKDHFSVVETLINECRKNGNLPVDFTADEEGRNFSGIEKPDDGPPERYIRDRIWFALYGGQAYIPDWWDGEDFYIQMIVEKIDLKTLFEPVCKKYKIPIATSKGWSSIIQRAEYARRFNQAEMDGKKCILLYCGDHDPDGLRISETLRKNLEDVAEITWADGELGYDPLELEIERFGLNYDFIEENNLTWIDNLITGSGRDLASKRHKNHNLLYVQDYLSQYGPKKCEANALIVNPSQAKELCTEIIERYLGEGAEARFKAKRKAVMDHLNNFRKRMGLIEPLKKALAEIDRLSGEDEEDEEDGEYDEE